MVVVQWSLYVSEFWVPGINQSWRQVSPSTSPAQNFGQDPQNQSGHLFALKAVDGQEDRGAFQEADQVWWQCSAPAVRGGLQRRLAGDADCRVEHLGLHAPFMQPGERLCKDACTAMF